MAKKVVADVVAELKKLLESKKLILGTDETVKFLRQGKVKKIFLASNCSPQVKDDLAQYCKVGNVECVELSQSNEEIGVLCKKPFAISVVGVSA
jgi:large subunit ribosomal protein L30e